MPKIRENSRTGIYIIRRTVAAIKKWRLFVKYISLITFHSSTFSREKLADNPWSIKLKLKFTLVPFDFNNTYFSVITVYMSYDIGKMAIHFCPFVPNFSKIWTICIHPSNGLLNVCCNRMQQQLEIENPLLHTMNRRIRFCLLIRYWQRFWSRK